MTYIMSCVWLDYMVKYFQCKNCVGSSPKTKKCVASFLVPGDKEKPAEMRGFPLFMRAFRLFTLCAYCLFFARFCVSRAQKKHRQI